MTRHARHRIAGTTLLAGAALALGACTGPGASDAPSNSASPGSDHEATTGTRESTHHPEAGADQAPPTADVAPEPSPFQALFDEAYGHLASGDHGSEQVHAEQVVAQCMAALGFEYVPVGLDGAIGITPQEAHDPDAPPPGARESVAQWGFGVSTWDVGGEPDDDVDAEQQDPNAEYVASLSESAREAYELALHGVAPTDEEIASGTWAPDPGTRGCRGEAADVVWSSDDAWNDPRFASLVAELSLVATDLDGDPEVVTATELWRACMAELGYPGFEDPVDAIDLVQDGLRDIWTGHEPPDADALDALREQERTIALADFDCAEESRLEDARRNAQFRAEQEFIDSHRAELEGLLTAIRAERDAAAG